MPPLIISKGPLYWGTPHGKSIQNKFCFIKGTEMEKLRHA